MEPGLIIGQWQVTKFNITPHSGYTWFTLKAVGLIEEVSPEATIEFEKPWLSEGPLELSHAEIYVWKDFGEGQTEIVLWLRKNREGYFGAAVVNQKYEWVRPEIQTWGKELALKLIQVLPEELPDLNLDPNWRNEALGYWEAA